MRRRRWFGLATPIDWWLASGFTPWAAYQPKGATNFAASLLDLTGNGNHASDPGGANTPTWDPVNGWKFDGIQQYLVTTFVPRVDQSQSMLVQFTNLTGPGGLAGSLTGAGQFYYLYWSGVNRTYANGNFRIFGAPTVAGNMAIAGPQGYFDGAVNDGLCGAVANPAPAVYIGALNDGGVAAFFCPVYVQAVAVYDSTLTAPPVAVQAAAMAAL